MMPSKKKVLHHKKWFDPNKGKSPNKSKKAESPL
jgi:hypothetical protein